MVWLHIFKSFQENKIIYLNWQWVGGGEEKETEKNEEEKKKGKKSL